MAGELANKGGDAILSSMGMKGAVLITDTTAVTGEFRGMKVIADATFTLLTTPNVTKNGPTTAVVAADWGTLSENSVIETKITACTLTSGKVLLYK